MERLKSGGEEEFIEFSAVAEEYDDWTIVLDQSDFLHYCIVEFSLRDDGIRVNSSAINSESRGNCVLIEYFISICELPLFVLREDLKRACDSEDGLEVIGKLCIGELSNHQSDLKRLSQIVIRDIVARVLIDVGEDGLITVAYVGGNGIVVLVH